MTIDAETLRGNFVWNAFVEHHHGQRRHRGSGFTDINCPMCTSRGETADRRYRCGVRPNVNGLGVNCFNCGFKGGWTRGRRLSRDMKEFLAAAGIPGVALARLEAMAALLSRHEGDAASTTLVMPPSKFPTIALPPGSRSIDDWAAADCDDPDFLDVASYLLSRGEVAAQWPHYHWTSSTKDGMNRRIILPFLEGGSVVGYTARAVDVGASPRYVGAKPADFLFNNAVLRLRSRRYIVLVEGAFDAFAIDGVGLLGSTVTARQVAWLKSTGQIVIVVPDRDLAGQKLVDIALQHNWRVAFPGVANPRPFWDRAVTDVAQAVREYGRLWTLMSIVESSIADRPKIISKMMFNQIAS